MGTWRRTVGREELSTADCTLDECEESENFYPQKVFELYFSYCLASASSLSACCPLVATTSYNSGIEDSRWNQIGLDWMVHSPRAPPSSIVTGIKTAVGIAVGTGTRCRDFAQNDIADAVLEGVKEYSVYGEVTVTSSGTYCLPFSPPPPHGPTFLIPPTWSVDWHWLGCPSLSLYGPVCSCWSFGNAFATRMSWDQIRLGFPISRAWARTFPLCLFGAHKILLSYAIRLNHHNI